MTSTLETPILIAYYMKRIAPSGEKGTAMDASMSPTPLEPPTPNFPTDHVVGIVKDFQAGEQALQALRNAGHAEDRLHLIQSQEVVEGIQGRLQDRNLFKKILHQLATTSDDGYAGLLYLEQARGGWHMIA